MSTTAIDVRTFPNLRAGDEGDWVRYLQRALVFHQDPALSETGSFDRPTAGALAAFQTRMGLAAAGTHEVDTETWWHLTSPTSLLPTSTTAPVPEGAWVVVAVTVAA